mgnify:CR=1 FL=1
MISVHHPPHRVLEADITVYLVEAGYAVESATFHDTYAPDVASLLKRRDSPTALYLRARADRVAVHRQHPVEFEWEAKTHQSATRRDLCLELLPLLLHRLHARCDVACLYCCRIAGRDVGCWADRIPIDTVMLPATVGPRVTWFRGLTWRFLPDACLVELPTVAGSGDPFVIVPEAIWMTWADWRVLIDALIPEEVQREPTDWRGGTTEQLFNQ